MAVDDLKVDGVYNRARIYSSAVVSTLIGTFPSPLDAHRAFVTQERARSSGSTNRRETRETLSPVKSTDYPHTRRELDSPNPVEGFVSPTLLHLSSGIPLWYVLPPRARFPSVRFGYPSPAFLVIGLFS
ncbi:hypothetical protein TNCV_3323951 [Trichonephila clavipes]|nr:hypothetical protein TNCV_3323951 [Trichonephila clavipes]